MHEVVLATGLTKQGLPNICPSWRLLQSHRLVEIDAIIIALVVEVLGTFGAPPADRLHLECKDAGTLH